MKLTRQQITQMAPILGFSAGGFCYSILPRERFGDWDLWVRATVVGTVAAITILLLSSFGLKRSQ